MRPPVCVHCGATTSVRLRGGHRPMSTPTGHPPGAQWVCTRCALRRQGLCLAGLLLAAAATAR